MENNPEWHHKSPNLEEYIKIVSSLLIDDVVKLKGKIPDIGQSDDEKMVLAGVADVTKNVIGNIAEVGVYSGGSAKLIKRFKNNDKKMYLFDTFSGLSDCNENDGEYLKNGFFIYDYELVKKEFEDDKDVTLYKGYFPDSTNIDIDNDNFSLVHLDVDTYTSTLNCLNYFYDKMTKGGIIVIHDYQMHSQIDGVPLAVDEFLSDKNEIIITLNTTQGLINKL